MHEDISLDDEKEEVNEEAEDEAEEEEDGVAMGGDLTAGDLYGGGYISGFKGDVVVREPWGYGAEDDKKDEEDEEEDG